MHIPLIIDEVNNDKSGSPGLMESIQIINLSFMN